ncbi:MAG: alcohol dehydrogenase catalytic domain-containing protein, partial [Candidatus Omnitrophica bacterium]|nr:alcohol dehydrogenase catalytic domain-containing protein [Candidatus Omnitrophota bacterium]
VKVKVVATAICHSDIHFIKGDWGGRTPFIAGHETSAIIEEVGEGVDSIKVGDKVVVSVLRSCGRCRYCIKGLPHLCEEEFLLDRGTRLHTKDGKDIYQGLWVGGFAEYVVVHQSQVVKIPEGTPLDIAALLGCGVITGVGAVLNTAKVETGNSVAVIGVGGVGLNVVQGAKLVNAYPIVAMDILDKKLERSRDFGATHTININFTHNLNKEIKDITSGWGVDYVFITVGNSEAITKGCEIVNRGGKIIIVGVPKLTTQVALNVLPIVKEERKFIGSWMGSTCLKIDIPKLIKLYQRGNLKLDELITHRYPLSQINDAIKEVEEGDVIRNLIVLD